MMLEETKTCDDDHNEGEGGKMVRVERLVVTCSLWGNARKGFCVKEKVEKRERDETLGLFEAYEGRAFLYPMQPQALLINRVRTRELQSQIMARLVFFGGGREE